MDKSKYIIIMLISIIIALTVTLVVEVNKSSIVKYKAGNEYVSLEKFIPPKEVIQISATINGFLMLCKNGEIWYYRWQSEKYSLIKEKD